MSSARLTASTPASRAVVAKPQALRLLLRAVFSRGYDPYNSLDAFRTACGNVCIWRGAR